MEQIIHLKSDSKEVSIKMIRDDKSVMEKTITDQDFMKILKTEEKARYILPAPLFRNDEGDDYVPGMLCGEKYGKECKGVFFVPAAVNYMDIVGDKSNMPYPSVLFMLTAVNGSLVNSKCFAMKEKNIDELSFESRLYAFPFGNVMYSDAHICWGSNHMKDMYDFISLRSAISVFFSASSNKDYVHPGMTYSEKYGKYETFIRRIRKRKSFPDDALVESVYMKTLGELLDAFNLKEEK